MSSFDPPALPVAPKTWSGPLTRSAARPEHVRWLRRAALLALLALTIAGAWNHDLWAYDEPREVELARAMWRSHEYAYLELGGRPFLDKPPLFHATIASAFALFQAPSATLARLVTALWALGAIAVTAHFARRRLGPGAGLLAALVLVTTQRFQVMAHEVVLDVALVACTTAAIVFGHEAARERRRGLAVVAALALAAAFLTKGIVGVGLAGLVLAADLGLRRDGRGARTLLHPVVGLAFATPIAAYFLFLWHDAGPRAASFTYQLFWSNQFGRFVGTHGQKASSWSLYGTTWPEMLGAWTPAAALGLFAAARQLRRRELEASARDTLRFLVIWAVVPLVFLSLSSGRARAYALPVVPAYAGLVVAWWQTLARRGEWPRWVCALLGVGATLGALAVVGFVVAIGWVDSNDIDVVEVVGALVALGAGLGIAWGARRGAAFASSESAALLVCLILVGGLIVSWGTFAVRIGDRSRGYREIAEPVFQVAGERRIVLYHVSNSYSGTFAFARDRSTLELDEEIDPEGKRLSQELESADRDVVLGPAGAFEHLPAELRAELAVIWTGLRVDDRATPRKTWALCERRLVR